MERSMLLVVVILSLAFAQDNFQSAFMIYNDSSVVGTMLGTINYDFTRKFLRNDYTFDGGKTINEFFNFSTPPLRNLKCDATCDTETYGLPMPIYIKPNTASNVGAITLNGVSCQGWTMPAGVVQRAWFDTNGKICRAVFTGGKTIDFLNHMGPETADLTKFNANGWNCPQPTCNKPMDIILVFDESGSIFEADFAREVDFGKQLANGYTFGPNAVAMGLVQFSTGSKVSIPLTNDKSQFLNAIARLVQNGGGTCLGCGLEAAINESRSIRARNSVTKVFIFLTDGANSLQLNKLAPAADEAHRIAIVFAIGVQSATAGKPLPEQINQIASTIPGVNTSFPNIPSFAALQGLLANLISLTCLDIAGTPCGASCRGFCACKGTCICPSSCNDTNYCTSDSCNPNINGAGCTWTDVSTTICNDNNFCTTETCNPSLGCIRGNVTCNDPDACTLASCNPASGCQFRDRNCNDNNPCTEDTCDGGIGCVRTPVECDRCTFPQNVTCPPIPCFFSECLPQFGNCSKVPFDCDDGNECTIDSCDVNRNECIHVTKPCDDNNACTYDNCDPTRLGGCVFKNFTEDYCDDFNACTIDSCNITVGCVNTNRTCDDLNPCTVDGCNSAIGCIVAPFDCLSIPRIRKLMGDCYNALCDPVDGCYLQQLPNTIIDRCGICNGDGNSCAYIPLPSNVPIVVGGSLLAVIVIAAIVVAGALGIFGGKKGYDIWLAHRNNMTGAQTSPLYTDNGLSGQSPLYSA
eukprot:TRINITY_DN1992_c0_g1_i2.p1 TRINITY_DN1992_c0_g1~~TRINITY_DN1992_c0_g1_i2.p1  ORF type:complete len:749 (+),score=162.65 TRINITY_DN1992_c0_g1_i2:89-2335(+)